MSASAPIPDISMRTSRTPLCAIWMRQPREKFTLRNPASRFPPSLFRRAYSAHNRKRIFQEPPSRARWYGRVSSAPDNGIRVGLVARPSLDSTFVGWYLKLRQAASISCSIVFCAWRVTNFASISSSKARYSPQASVALRCAPSMVKLYAVAGLSLTMKW